MLAKKIQNHVGKTVKDNTPNHQPRPVNRHPVAVNTDADDWQPTDNTGVRHVHSCGRDCISTKKYPCNKEGSPCIYVRFPDGTLRSTLEDDFKSGVNGPDTIVDPANALSLVESLDLQRQKRAAKKERQKNSKKEKLNAGGVEKTPEQPVKPSAETKEEKTSFKNTFIWMGGDAWVDEKKVELIPEFPSATARSDAMFLSALLNGPPTGYRIVIDHWAMTKGFKKYSAVTMTLDEWNSEFKDANLTPDQVEDVSNVGCHVNGIFYLWDEKTKIRVHHKVLNFRDEDIVASTACGVLMLVKGTIGNVPRLVRNQPSGNQTNLLEASAYHAFLKCDMSKSWDNNYMMAKIKTYYLGYYPSYSTIDRDLSAFVQSPAYLTMLEQWLAGEATSWEKRMRITLKATFIKENKNRDLDLEIRKRMNWVVKTRACSVDIPKPRTCVALPEVSVWNLFVSTAATAAAYFLPMVVGEVVGTGIAAAFMVTQEKYTAQHALLDLYDDHVVYPTLTRSRVVACSKLYIKKTVIEPDRIDMATQPTFKMKTNYVRAKPMEVPDERCDIYGATIPCQMVYPTSSDQNLEAAMNIRMGFKRDVDDDYLEGFIKFAKSYIDNLPTFELDHISDEENLSFLSKKYGAKVAANMIKNADRVLTLQDLVYGAFVKKETYAGKNPETFKPRMIWNCPPIIIAKFGAYFDKLSKCMTKLFNSDSDIFYANCTSPQEVGRFGEKMTELPFLYESDVSSWDGSMLRAIIQLEKYFLETKVIGMPEEFAFMLKNWGINKARSSTGGVEVSMDYGRRSGDLWTSCFNSLLNIILTEYMYGVENEKRICVLGDDNVVSTRDRVNVADVVESYKKLGMKCEIIERSCLEEATFCSGRFWKVDGAYKWGNLPFRTLAKFGFNHNFHNSKIHKQLLYGTAKSLLPSCGHVPIIGAFMRAVCESAEKSKIRARVDSKDFNPYRIHGGLISVPDTDTYAQFSALYELSIEEITLIELWLSQTIDVNKFPLLLAGSVYREGFCVDTGCIDEVVDELRALADNQSKIPEVGEPSLDEINHYTIEIAPLEEEIEKLKGVSSTSEAFASGWSFGTEEDYVLGSRSHAPLHALFSTLSYWHLDWGVSLHRKYNEYAIATNIPPARKRKGGKPKQQSTTHMTTKSIKDVVKGAVKAALIGGGAAVGNAIGGPAGGFVGGKAGALISRLVGSGDYTVKSNSIVSRGMTFGDDSREIRVKHHEYLGDVFAASDFSVRSVAINPGLPGNFSWVAQLADAFQQYSLKGCVFYFRSTSAEWSGVGQSLGTVIMGTNYDVTKPDFTSKIEMENYMFSNSGKPSEHMMHPIECAPGMTPVTEQYLRSGPLSADQDPKFYDFANFQIAVTGCDPSVEGQPIGELWVAYDVCLLKPQYPPGGVIPGQYYSTQGGGVSATELLGAIRGTEYGNLDLSITATGAGYDTINFPATISGGRFLVAVTWNGSTAATWTANSPSVLTNCTLVSWFGASGVVGRTSTGKSPTSGVTTSNATYIFVVTIDGYSRTGSSIQFVFGAIPIVGTTTAQVDIVCIPGTNEY